jgi:hypothetical protein
MIGEENRFSLRQKMQGFVMQMIRMPMRDPNELGVLGIADLLLAEGVIKRPAAEIAGADQPRIRHQNGRAINTELDRGVAESFKS